MQILESLDQIIAYNSEISIMEHQSKTSSLQLKLNLLRALKQSDINHSHQILKTLQASSQTHPELYKQFFTFVSQHKSQIISMEKRQKQQSAKFIYTDDNNEGSWKTEDSISYSSNQEYQQTQQINETSQPSSKPLKNLANSKSAVHLKPLKDIKRPFLVQTKLKENNNNASSKGIGLPSSTVIKIGDEERILHKVESKPSLLAKEMSKKNIRSYFPPINKHKSSLKLT